MPNQPLPAPTPPTPPSNQVPKPMAPTQVVPSTPVVQPGMPPTPPKPPMPPQLPKPVAGPVPPVPPKAPAVPAAVPQQPANPAKPVLSNPPAKPPQAAMPGMPPAPVSQRPPAPPAQPPVAPQSVSAAPVTSPAPMTAQPTTPAVPTVPKPPTGPMVPPPPGVRPLAAPGAATLTAPRPASVVPPPTNPGGQPPAPPAQPPAAPKPAKVQSSMFRFLPFVLIGVLILGVVGFLATRFLNQGTTDPTADPSSGGIVPVRQTTITYWGLWEPSSVLQDVITDFETANPGINVEYVQQSHVDYRERLQTEIAQGSGPDVYRFHASWVPMLRNDLAPMPSSVFSSSEYQQTFYPVAADQLQLNGQIMGVPLMYDGLALFYNTDMLRVANASVPTTWAELKTLASQLTVRSGNQVQRGGLAIGNTSNVEHFSDILGLLMLQNGADFMNPTTTEARDALDFYTSFFRTDRVWSESLPSSTVAFARGDVAMMFAPSWRVFEVKALNPSLNFATAPVPKLGNNQISWASYWAEGVNAQSKNKDQAWALIKYMSSPEVMRKLHSEQSSVRAFGEIHSRVDLANELGSQPLVVPFLTDAPQAQNWYLNSFTHDDGINDQIIKYYADAINAVNQGKKPEDVLFTVAQGTAQVLRQYGIQMSGGSQAGGSQSSGPMINPL